MVIMCVYRLLKQVYKMTWLFGLWTCMWLSVLQSLCSVTTCAPVKGAPANIHAVCLINEVCRCIYLWSRCVCSNDLTGPWGEDPNPMKKQVCWEHSSTDFLSILLNLLLYHSKEATSVYTHKRTAGVTSVHLTLKHCAQFTDDEGVVVWLTG